MAANEGSTKKKQDDLFHEPWWARPLIIILLCIGAFIVGRLIGVLFP